jgi:D-amino peptidase
MRIYILTDQEGVAGVVSSVDYATPESRYYETARRLLTLEVNAAVEGALAGGATDIFILDGHGHGSIDVELLHEHARVLTGRPIRFPFCFDGSFDALMFVGQHAKANTDGGHLSHTGSMHQDDLILNRRSLGELGWYVQLAGHYGKPTILVTGDEAVCDEMRALVPETEVVAVKAGLRNGPATGLTADENRLHNGAAVHLSPTAARKLIREAAERAVRRIGEIPPFFIPSPYEMVSILRADSPDGDPTVAINRHDDFVELGKLERVHNLTIADIPFELDTVT